MDYNNVKNEFCQQFKLPVIRITVSPIVLSRTAPQYPDREGTGDPEYPKGYLLNTADAD